MIERGPWVSNFKLGSAATYNLLLQVKRMEETPKTDRERGRFQEEAREQRQGYELTSSKKGFGPLPPVLRRIVTRF